MCKCCLLPQNPFWFVSYSTKITASRRTMSFFLFLGKKSKDNEKTLCRSAISNAFYKRLARCHGVGPHPTMGGFFFFLKM